MKTRIWMWVAGLTLVAPLAAPLRVVGQEAQSQHLRNSQHYAVTDLGTLEGGTFSQATGVNNHGLVTGLSTVADGTLHAFLWYKGVKIDIGKHGLGGPNSAALGLNDWGQVVGQAENSTQDPNGENFCGFFTGLECVPFLWQAGVLTPLPTLGGNNATVDDNINNRGEIVGIAENSTSDPDCPSTPAVNGTGPQILDFEAVIWGPRRGQIRELPPLAGDTVGMALWINDKGQAVGTSGTCANTVLPPFAVGPHAVLWDKDGSVQDLGNLGGTANPEVLGVGNLAFTINNSGEIAGASALPGNQITHAFRWTRTEGMRDLGALPGDLVSAGLGINNRGDVVGASIDTDLATGNPRAVLWHNGVINDLNDLVPSDSSLYLLTAFTINDLGEIAGFGVDPNSGEVHAFVAVPCDPRHAGEKCCKNLKGKFGRPSGWRRPALSKQARRLVFGRRMMY
jgi:probable HAF family extracellular repeat protein